MILTIAGRSYGKDKMKNTLWAWKGSLTKAEAKVDWALRRILEGLVVFGSIPGIGPSRKPICVGRVKRQAWAPKCKLRPKTKSQVKLKPNRGLGREEKPATLMGAPGMISVVPNQNSTLLEKVPEVVMVVETAACVIQREGMTLDSARTVNCLFGSPLVRANATVLLPVA